MSQSLCLLFYHRMDIFYTFVIILGVQTKKKKKINSGTSVKISRVKTGRRLVRMKSRNHTGDGKLVSS